MENNVNEVPVRIFDVRGEFNDKMADEFLDWCMSIEEYDLQFRDEDLFPVCININSQGGSCSSLDAMLDGLELLRCKIITRGFGSVMSCALHLFLEGDERVCGTHCRFLWHDISFNMGQSTLTDYNEQLKEMTKMQQKYDDVFIERTDVSKNMLKKYAGKDWVFDREEAIKLGIVNNTSHPSNMLLDFYLMTEEGNENE